MVKIYLRFIIYIRYIKLIDEHYINKILIIIKMNHHASTKQNLVKEVKWKRRKTY